VHPPQVHPDWCTHVGVLQERNGTPVCIRCGQTVMGTTKMFATTKSTMPRTDEVVRRKR